MNDTAALSVANLRPDLAAIAEWIQPGKKVLDLGCGDGSLLRYLHETKDVFGYGVEINDQNLLNCFYNGINVIQNDLESGLSSFESGSFDYVILSQTLQAMRHTEDIFSQFWILAQSPPSHFRSDADVESAPIPLVRHA